MPDAIVILGLDPGPRKELSKQMKSRLTFCIEYFYKNPCPIILSGRYALKYKKDPGFRESKIMKQFLLKKGISNDKILIEDKSQDTAGNALFTKQIIKKHGWKNILVITSDFHIKRTKATFKIIFGNEYKISCKGAMTNLSSEKHKEIKKRELKSIKDFKKICKAKKIKNGDDLAIKKLLKNFYANYHSKEQ
jgi:uncharacterized SAM-binding protein YcdF (DUF218 family)